MYSFKKNKSFLPLVIIPLLLVMNNCTDRSEFGEASDYEKLGSGATTGGTGATTGACTTGEDITAPTVSSASPTDNSTYNSVATTVAVTFSEKMETATVTTNTSDTTCSGSFQLSSDNFTSCIKMSAAPVASDNDTIFTITPASSLSAATTYKTK
ncbi:MAG: Ig-like domain-containing protein, partial [SAR324 cluster bacterium]|nr:Ig-like domain-containing protein [SAR324 cluster bacterium]